MVYLSIYLLSILLIGYRKSRATSAAEWANELSTDPRSGPNIDPKILLRLFIACGLGDTASLSFSFCVGELTSPRTSSSSAGRGDLRIPLRKGDDDLRTV